MVELKMLGVADAAELARLVAARNGRILAGGTALPGGKDEAGAIEPKLGWLLGEAKGAGYGAYEGGVLLGFLCAFPAAQFKAPVTGAYSPDWASALRPGADGRLWRRLYDACARDWAARGWLAHALTIPSAETAQVAAFQRTGFGAFVADAIREAGAIAGADRDLARGGGQSIPGVELRRATASDAEALSRLCALHYEHLRSCPAFLYHEGAEAPEKHAAWLAEEGHVAWIAYSGGKAAGYLRMEPTPDDTAWLVQDPRGYHITGAEVLPELRGRGVASALLAALDAEARSRGGAWLSVDWETTNPEADAFWAPRFREAAISLYRRLDERVAGGAAR